MGLDLSSGGGSFFGFCGAGFWVGGFDPLLSDKNINEGDGAKNEGPFVEAQFVGLELEHIASDPSHQLSGVDPLASETSDLVTSFEDSVLETKRTSSDRAPGVSAGIP